MTLPRISPHTDPGMPQRLIPENQLMLDMDINYAAQLLGKYFFERNLIRFRKFDET
jgi:hypothetical protein